MTYAGPHAPTIHDSWGGGRLRDEMLAQMGYVVFRCDPRSASGKGACSAWTAYRQLGVQELKDIETAIHWLTKHSVRRRRPHRHERPQLRRLHDGLRPDAQQALRGRQLPAPRSPTGATTTPIYTERYMNTPQENPDGYNKTTVVRAARNLHGKLLLGTRADGRQRACPE